MFYYERNKVFRLSCVSRKEDDLDELLQPLTMELKLSFTAHDTSLPTFPCLSGSDHFEHQNTPGQIEICAFDNNTQQPKSKYQQQNNKSP